MPSLGDIPKDVSWLILKYLDVSSILSLSQVSPIGRDSKHHNKLDLLMRLCYSDDLWGYLVKRRFAIDATKPYQRPTSYGGSNWKNAYRLLARCHKMPRSRISQRKVVFAKSVGSNRRNDCNDRSSGVLCWVLVGHTDDCRLRRQAIIQESDDSIPPREDKFIELHVCFQLISPSAIRVNLDFSASYVQLRGEPSGKGNIILLGSKRPKVIHRSFGGKSQRRIADAHGAMREDEYDSCNNILSIKTLEFVVVAINVVCPQDMVYETDFLSRAIALHIPTCLEKEIALRSSPNDVCPESSLSYVWSSSNKRPREMLPIELYNHFVNGMGEEEAQNGKELRRGGHDNSRSPAAAKMLRWIKVLHPGYISALFLNEKDFWSHYIELPGHCLALSSTVHSNFT